MERNFKQISYPEDLEYASDGDYLPIEFYLDVLPASKEIYLKLGYFSSSAIQTLSYGFAQFIHNGGRIKIISNHYMYNQDKELLQRDISLENASKKEYLLSDLGWISGELNRSHKHFFNCLKLLVSLDRLELVPVIQKPKMMMHYKQGVFIDGDGNSLSMDGSCNFTRSGLLENAESISISRSWGGKIEEKRVINKKNNIIKILDRGSDKHEYLKSADILDAFSELGEDKSIESLLNDERHLLSSNLSHNSKRLLDKYEEEIKTQIKAIKEEPRFPYPEPRDYQEEAYKQWLKSDKKGIFAMATGTGKTLTALNCLLHEFKNSQVYQTVILVPSKDLLEQWYEEVREFNFKSIIRASSDYKWSQPIDHLNTQLAFDQNISFIIIAIYDTFSTLKFQKKTNNLPDSTLLIADEAHNIGAPTVKKVLPKLKYSKRIALSATPNRRFDPEGNELIEEFFNSKEPYTYSFSMERAIKERILCPYLYHPHIVYLSQEEMDKYVEISKRISRLFDHATDSFRNLKAAQKLMLERTQIIHKAQGKFEVFQKIIDSLVNERGTLGYTFVYVPEGYDSLEHNFLDQYLGFVDQKYPSVRAHHYTSKTDNRSEVMTAFEEGNIDCLFSMKCLDEGVDVPRAEVAVFCSSTGNPRQFIQRRGRVLRQHPEKDYAIIHDLVVLPIPSVEQGSLKSEKKLIKDELTRVIYFSSLSRNYYDCMEKFKDIAEFYELNMFAMQGELEDKNHGK